MKKEEEPTYDEEGSSRAVTVSSVKYLNLIVQVRVGGGLIRSDVAIRHRLRGDRVNAFSDRYTASSVTRAGFDWEGRNREKEET